LCHFERGVLAESRNPLYLVNPYIRDSSTRPAGLGRNDKRSRMRKIKFIIKNKKGFTLAEILVAMAVFTTSVTSIANIFMFANRTQRKTQAGLESQTDARFAMEVMAQQVRRGNIDYAYYGGAIAANPQTVLAVIDNNNNHIQFRRQAAAGQGIIQISQDNGVTWADITPPEISVSTLAFYISPATDPFALVPAANQQPLVTIALTTTNTTTEGASMQPMFIQTTVSSRQYLR